MSTSMSAYRKADLDKLGFALDCYLPTTPPQAGTEARYLYDLLKASLDYIADRRSVIATTDQTAASTSFTPNTEGIDQSAISISGDILINNIVTDSEPPDGQKHIIRVYASAPASVTLNTTGTRPFNLRNKDNPITMDTDYEAYIAVVYNKRIAKWDVLALDVA